jgi:hypothetical protein
MKRKIAEECVKSTCFMFVRMFPVLLLVNKLIGACPSHPLSTNSFRRKILWSKCVTISSTFEES